METVTSLHDFSPRWMLFRALLLGVTLFIGAVAVDRVCDTYLEAARIQAQTGVNTIRENFDQIDRHNAEQLQRLESLRHEKSL